MKFTVNTNEFKIALEKVFKVTGTKTIETLENVLIRKIGNEVHLLSTNLEQFVDMKIEGFGDDAEFQFSNTKAILKAIKFFTEYQIEFESAEYEVTISCGGKKAKQRILDADFPEFPIVDGEIHNKFEYSNKKLKERFNAVKYAASSDESRKLLTGICFRNCDMAAIDGFRVAINKDDNLNVSTSFVTPLVSIKNINEIMKENINIITNGKYMQVVDGNTVFITRLFDGEYMDYSKIINDRTGKPIEVDVKDFINGIKYLKTFKNAKEKEGIHWYYNKLGFKNMNGYFESEIDADGEMATEIRFNGDYMQEALRQFCDKVTINISTNISPMLITSENDSNNIAVVLPLKLKETMFSEAA